MHRHLVFGIAGEQPVERVGQIAVGGKTHRVGRGQDRRQPRVRFRVEAPAHQVGRQPLAGHRHQRALVEVQQRDRVAGQDRTDRRDQSLELDLARHGVGEIDRNLPQRAVDGLLETHEAPDKRKATGRLANRWRGPRRAVAHAKPRPDSLAGR